MRVLKSLLGFRIVENREKQDFRFLYKEIGLMLNFGGVDYKIYLENIIEGK